jgi:hypothetical protein
MFNVEDFTLAVYCLVDDLLSELVRIHTNGLGLRPGRMAPHLSDSEVITMMVVGEFLSLDSDKAIWKHFRRHGRHLFPRIGDRSRFIRQGANLWWFVGALHRVIAKRLGALDDEVHIIDGFPMELANINRAARTRSFRGEAARGYCAAKKHHYFGFRGHLVISFDGVVTACAVTAANVDERQATWDVIDNLAGQLLGDKGYIGQFFASLLKEQGIVLLTPVRKNMTQPTTTPWTWTMGRIRRRIETVIGQLVERFHIGKVRARDRWHLTLRVNRKILSHTIARYLMRQMGIDSMELEELVAA